MRRPSDLTREELVHIVEQVQRLLYLGTDAAGEAFWNPDKGWDSETVELEAAALADAGLVPRARRGMKCEHGKCRRAATWFCTWNGKHYCGRHLCKAEEKALEEAVRRSTQVKEPKNARG
jgi:hypothetical protein